MASRLVEAFHERSKVAPETVLGVPVQRLTTAISRAVLLPDEAATDLSVVAMEAIGAYAVDSLYRPRRCHTVLSGALIARAKRPVASNQCVSSSTSRSRRTARRGQPLATIGRPVGLAPTPKRSAGIERCVDRMTIPQPDGPIR
ncbi:hypothetical protein AB0C42_01690 [Micromonospora taraxaci]|uniref:hypothetical protein n=1 Tax=Micromonospora taraxaci TaxID=1316803 RepID=UPI0033F0E11C